MSKKLRKLIREAYIKAVLKENMKNSLDKIFEEDKEFYEEVKNIMLDGTEAPVETPVKPDTDKPVTPSKRPAPVDPRKIPGPKKDPAPAKAELKESISSIDIFKKIKLLENIERMNQLIKEDVMRYPEGESDRPHPETEKRLQKRGDETSTPFADINFFMREKEGQTTQERIASKEFEELIRKSKEVGKSSGWGEVGQLLFALGQLEKPHKAKLVSLAKKVVQKELGLSQDIIDNIAAELLTPNEGRIDDFDSSSSPDEEDIPLTDEEKEIVGGEIKIRKIMNSMMMGAGYKLFDVLKDFKSELDAIDRRLYPIYTKLNPNANLLLWKIPPYDIGGRMPAGSVKLERKEENPEELQVKAKALNFAVLLHEIAKGALEYLLVIRLEDFSDNLRNAIFKAADSYKEEHFMKILGPQIWKQVFYAIEVALDEYEQGHELHGLENKKEMLPLFINKMATMSAEDFNNLIDDLLNPGQAEESGREEPLQRIKNIIDSINTSIKEFLDSQNEETAEDAVFDLGQDNTQNITQSARENMDDWVDDLETKLNNQEEVSEEDLNNLSVEELTDRLNNALEEENYELASIIRDIISSK
jgi:hypothetical protein